MRRIDQDEAAGGTQRLVCVGGNRVLGPDLQPGDRIGLDRVGPGVPGQRFDVQVRRNLPDAGAGLARAVAQQVFAARIERALAQPAYGRGEGRAQLGGAGIGLRDQIAARRCRYRR